MRFKVFAGIFIGYAGYYLVRKNFSLIKPDLIEMGWDKGELGYIGAALSIAYGISKFVMGNVSDRSNPKIFLSLGLGASALIMAVWGLVDWAFTSLALMIVLNFLNGWVQGMGWPACGRTLAHWYSQSERGTVISFWNVAHTMLEVHCCQFWPYGEWLYFSNDWKSALYFPAAIALIVAIVIYFLVDTPQSCGLPTIEEHNKDFSGGLKQVEHELSAAEILFKYVLNNKWIWCIAIANAFIYLIRYGVLDWAPTYLYEVKNFDKEAYSWAFAYYELAGIRNNSMWLLK